MSHCAAQEVCHVQTHSGNAARQAADLQPQLKTARNVQTLTGNNNQQWI